MDRYDIVLLFNVGIFMFGVFHAARYPYVGIFLIGFSIGFFACSFYDSLFNCPGREVEDSE
ncbi:hypothetical protein [Methanolobus sp. WCC4]|uniref:hypothetical protein n=1 Tax=Methanolobus sp. WCC4 TaxID=3125784 RepID=UPI0030F51563